MAAPVAAAATYRVTCANRRNGEEMTVPFRVLEVDGGYALEGELDSATAGLVDDLAASVDGASVIVDLSAATFVDSSGLHALRRLRLEHPGVRLVNPAPQLR